MYSLYHVRHYLSLWFTNHPFFLLLTLAVPAGFWFFILRHPSTSASEDRAIRYLRHLASLASISFVAVYLGVVATYALSPVFLDHIEPNIAIVSWLFANGQPVYHALDAPSRYSFMYGPLLYLINAGILTALGPSIFAAKLGGILAALGSILFAYLAFRRAEAKWNAMAYTGMMCALVLLFEQRTFWIRADSFLFLCATLGLAASRCRSGVVAAMACGLALGAAPNLKAHGAMYCLPFVALFIQHHGLRHLWLLVSLAAAAAVAPYLHAGIDFWGMIAWLQAAAKHGLQLRMFAKNIEWLLYAATPALLVLAYLAFTDRQRLWLLGISNRLVLGSFLCGAGVIIVVASKPGAGANHLTPFFPFLVYVFARLLAQIDLRRLQSATAYRAVLVFALAFVVSLTMLALVKTKTVLTGTIFKQPEITEVIADIRSIMSANPGSRIGMGVGDGSKFYRTFYRTLLVFSGHPYLIDASALIDMQYAGVEIPTQTIDELESGATDLWLIPKGDEPFRFANWYNGEPMFPEKFRQAFLRSYEPRKPSQFFDLWRRKSKEE